MTDAPARLIVFSGLPGAGKTTLARDVAARLGAVFLRVDVIEQAILGALPGDVELGAAGYAVAHGLAESNLSLGARVVADCVNPSQLSRAVWRAVAQRASTAILEVEVVCTDRVEHRRRLEQRRADIAGHQLPTWEDVERLSYEAWTEPHLVIDTALMSQNDAVERVVSRSA